ncbi:hypothetical protein AS030_06560 [Fictibacillus enclensis]|uniref:Transposase n=1 Tax=Fictibacillus enclensis TaxID=1017270 RepID=A0A0V8JDF5_9BACL|nr:hypothetical protein AS030_06560 [Fictibacillus enclensis]
MDRKTIRKHIHSATAPSKQSRKKKSKLDSYKKYLHRRMMEDHVFNGKRLLDEISQLGYQGGKTILKDYLKPFWDMREKNTPSDLKLCQENRCRWTGKRLEP